MAKFTEPSPEPEPSEREFVLPDGYDVSRLDRFTVDAADLFILRVVNGVPTWRRVGEPVEESTDAEAEP